MCCPGIPTRESPMKYGENLFGRRADPRANPVPTAANHPTATPALVPASHPQRPAATPATPSSSSASPSTGAPEGSPAGRSDESGSKLIVGPNIKLKGVEIE